MNDTEVFDLELGRGLAHDLGFGPAVAAVTGAAWSIRGRRP